MDRSCHIVHPAGEIPLRSPDHADALIWAVFELRQLSQPSYLAAYGLRSCGSCGLALRRELKECPECKTRVDPEPEPESLAPGSRTWSDAYLRPCRNGHFYPRQARTCPQCVMFADAYLRELDKFTKSGMRLTVGRELAAIWPRGGYRDA